MLLVADVKINFISNGNIELNNMDTRVFLEDFRYYLGKYGEVPIKVNGENIAEVVYENNSINIKTE